ncbi:hypothetical protein Pcinc_008311 [Petrolisthes cinctipes]|uniref:Uncharacterized protein n=1 Tax=Petrolisthes cinctipes TaxID=88211 RepID=A0AAE1G7J4_PETCI|nr:hypothetical protein Pcinc_008311 [Petrolisthes cinctipes]
MEEDRKSYKVSTDSPLPHAGDAEVTCGDVGDVEVVGDTTPTYGERRFSDFSLPHPLPAFQQEQQIPVLSPHPPQPQPATSTDLLQLFQYMERYRQQDEYYRRTPPPHYNTRHHLTTIIQDTSTPPQYQTPPIVHQDTPTPQQYQTPPIVHQDTPTPQQYQTPPHHNNTRLPHTTTIPDATCG